MSLLLKQVPVSESKIYTVFFFIVLPSVVACNNKHNCDFPKVVVSDLALQRLVNIIDNVENKKLSTNISVVE